ncbi:MAG: MerR family transcriptional regulator [candidate division NC10 bacterium]|nr:MerR family transcriptional regulator [candidate division NC10 bacterium]
MRRQDPAVATAAENGPFPDKLFYRIGEASRLTGVPSYVLRYWETEFEILHPQKSRSGQRLYRRRDLETILQIKELLYGEGFTIAGAKSRVRTQGEKRESFREENERKEILRSLRVIREGLQEIALLLSCRK